MAKVSSAAKASKRCWNKSNRAYHSSYALNNRGKLVSQKRERQRILRAAALEMYGGKCQCKGCDVTEPEFLAFDHKRGGGRKHRSQFGGQYMFYLWLLKSRRKSMQVLCHNCNSAKGYYGRCPHEAKE